MILARIQYLDEGKFRSATACQQFSFAEIGSPRYVPCTLDIAGKIRKDTKFIHGAMIHS